MKKDKFVFIGEIFVVVCLMIITAYGARNLEEETAHILIRITIPIIALIMLLVVKYIIDINDKEWPKELAWKC